MLPVSAWPPGSPGQWGSPFSRPWMVDLRRYPKGLTIPKGVWLASCHHNACVQFRVNLSLAMEQTSQPELLTSIPPVKPLPMLPPCPPPCPTRSKWMLWPPHPARTRHMTYDHRDDWIVNHVVVHPCQTGTVWSDGWNVRLCGCGKAMLIKVSQ